RFPLPHADATLAGQLRDLMARGAYRPVVDRTYDFKQIREAYAYVDSGRKVGNVVIVMPAAPKRVDLRRD
ncbi:MAG: zinc-binding dehydrogenase, partial [Ornithinimicrobium sp.]